MEILRKIAVLAIFALFISACATPKPAAPPSQLPDHSIAERLELHDANWSYLVVDMDTGDELATHAADTMHPPASTAKIPTMIAALGILGTDYQFETSLLADGKIIGNTLRGNLVLQGTGDPLLRPNDLWHLAIKLREFGIRQVEGQFAYHSTLPSFAVVSPQQQRTAPYNQGVSGLNLDFNRVRMTGRADGTYFLTPAEAKGLTPDITHVPSGGTIDFPINEPALFTARMFRKLAQFEGVELPPPVPRAPSDTSKILVARKSLPLDRIVLSGLEYSNNMVAEAIGLAAATKLGSPPNTLAESADRLTDWLKENITGQSQFDATFTNHSGLSTVSRVSPREMTTLLRETYSRTFGDIRFDTLLVPGGGREGYRGRFRQPENAFKIWAKTGSMHYIKGLAGYINADSGRRLAFAIFTNDLRQRGQMKIGTVQDDEKWRAHAGAWRDRVEAFEEEMIRRWISQY